MPEPCVCAVVLTCNRLEKSRRCIEAILGQTRSPDRVLVVDNGSTDGTVEWVTELSRNDDRIALLPLRENLGPAGGYAEGFEWVKRRDFDWIWAIDNDIYPGSTCLELLLREAGASDNVLLYPWTIDEPSGKVSNYPRWSAVLIPTRAIREGGVPRRELFWWIEDTEFLQWRLPRQLGMQSKLVQAAECSHDVDLDSQKASWKYYYEVRNTLWYRLRVQRGRWFRRAGRIIVVIAASTIRPLLREHHKIQKLHYVLLGIFHGITGRLGKVIDPAASTRNASP